MEDRLRVMPHNTDAEKCILGSILLDNELGKEIVPELRSEDFYLASHKEIFEKIAELYHTSKEIDLITLSDKLMQGGVLENVGGMEYLIELSDFLPSAANYKYHLEIVKRDSIRRKLIRESQQTIQDAFELEDTRMLIASAEKNIFDLAVTDQRAKPVAISETMVEVIDRFNEYAKNDGKLRGITTGFRDLDEMLNGLNRSDLVLVAARPAAGKTSFAMNIVENAACAGYTCAVFSLEMPKIQISQRIICSNAEVSMKSAFQGKLTDKDWENLMNAQIRLGETKIFVDDTASITPADIQSKCRSLKAQHGLDLVMVDYIQLMSSGSRRDQNRQLEIAEISRSLKLIARELDVPVVALSQLSRQVENRTPPIPQLSDLRDSGAIEQDADVIMFIHNPSAVKGEDGGVVAGGGNGESRQIMIAKHRNGQCGIIELGWRGEFTKFVNKQAVGSAQYVPPEKVVDKEAEEARTKAYEEAELMREKRRQEKESVSFGDSEQTEYDVPDYALPSDELLISPPPEDGYAVGDFVQEMPEVQIDEETLSSVDDELNW